MAGLFESVGNVLDLPGSALRDALMLRNPLDQFSTPFSAANRTSGSEMLNSLGMEGENPWLGMGVEMALDPMSWAGIGGLAKAFKGAGAGKAALAAAFSSPRTAAETIRNLPTKARQAWAAMRTKANPWELARDARTARSAARSTRKAEQAAKAKWMEGKVFGQDIPFLSTTPTQNAPYVLDLQPKNVQSISDAFLAGGGRNSLTAADIEREVFRQYQDMAGAGARSAKRTAEAEQAMTALRSIPRSPLESVLSKTAYSPNFRQGAGSALLLNALMRGRESNPYFDQFALDQEQYP